MRTRLNNRPPSEQARSGVEDAMKYLREASYGSDGSYPIASVATSSITFYANVNNDTFIEQVTYLLQNGTFYRVVGEPSGNPPTYADETYLDDDHCDLGGERYFDTGVPVLR